MYVCAVVHLSCILFVILPLQPAEAASCNIPPRGSAATYAPTTKIQQHLVEICFVVLPLLCFLYSLYKRCVSKVRNESEICMVCGSRFSRLVVSRKQTPQLAFL